MDNGHNQVNGFNPEVFQGQTSNPFEVGQDYQATGNKVLNFTPENDSVVAEAGSQIGLETSQMGVVTDVPGGAREMPGAIISFDPAIIKTDKKTGLSEGGMGAIEAEKDELSNTGDANKFYADIREGLMPANMKSWGREIEVRKAA